MTTTNATDLDPRQHLAELEARVLAGDTTITPAALAKARDADALATLRAEADRRRAERDAHGARQAAERSFRAILDAHARRLGEVQQAYGRVVAAIRDLAEQVDAWQQHRGALLRDARPLALADDVDAALIDLSGRDWIAAARDEAVGRLERGPGRWGGRGSVIHHALRSRDARARIDEADSTDQVARAARLREREERRLAERKANANFRAQAIRTTDDA